MQTRLITAKYSNLTDRVKLKAGIVDHGKRFII